MRLCVSQWVLTKKKLYPRLKDLLNDNGVIKEIYIKECRKVATFEGRRFDVITKLNIKETARRT